MFGTLFPKQGPQLCVPATTLATPEQGGSNCATVSPPGVAHLQHPSWPLPNLATARGSRLKTGGRLTRPFQTLANIEPELCQARPFPPIRKKRQKQAESPRRINWEGTGAEHRFDFLRRSKPDRLQYVAFQRLRKQEEAIGAHVERRWHWRRVNVKDPHFASHPYPYLLGADVPQKADPFFGPGGNSRIAKTTSDQSGGSFSARSSRR